MIKLPGLIDIHVHLRDPGQTQKEDFFTGSVAALAGGFTNILDMPNNKKLITTLQLLKEKMKSARKAICSIGFYAGSLGDNLGELKKIEPYVYGLKIYMNETTGNFIINEKKLKKIFSAWESKKPILFHAETDVIKNILKIAEKMKKRVHICHVSSQKELAAIITCKKNGQKVTCGVTPHHLFLTSADERKLGSFAMMKPSLKSKKDVDFLWQNLKYIDVIESDHAPHTIEEKKSKNPPFGVPGLETTLPLLLMAVSKKRLTMNRLVELCFINPKRIFNIKTDTNTFIEIDEKEVYIVDNKNLKTKCGWSPFHGWKVKGKVKRVFIRGKKVFELQI